MNAHERPIVTEGNKTAVRAGSTGNNVRYVLPGSVALDVSSQTLMAHSYRVIRRMRYGTDSTRERHNDRGGPSSDTT